MRSGEYRIGPGAASLLLVIVVISMSILGLLSLIEARNSETLATRAMEYAAREYDCAYAAERELARLDGILAAAGENAEGDEAYLAAVAALLPDNMKMDGDIVYWTQYTNASRNLECAVQIMPMNEMNRFVWKNHSFVSAIGEF